MTIAVVTVVVVTFFSKNNLTPPKSMRFLRAAFRDLAMFFLQPKIAKYAKYEGKILLGNTLVISAIKISSISSAHIFRK